MKSMNLDDLKRFLSAYLRTHWGHSPAWRRED
jgi:hypothetical protein